MSICFGSFLLIQQKISAKTTKLESFEISSVGHLEFSNSEGFAPLTLATPVPPFEKMPGKPGKKNPSPLAMD